MGLRDLVGALEDEGSRGMEGAEIGGSTGVFAELDREYGPSVSERLHALSRYRSASGVTDRCLPG